MIYLLLMFLAWKPYFGPSLKKIEKKDSVQMLEKVLTKSSHAYLREHAAIKARSYSKKQAASLIPELNKCMQNKEERSYVRVQCTLTLAKYGQDVTTEVKMMLTEFEGEDRYWLAMSLYHLKDRIKFANSELVSLQQDVDPLISSAARIWVSQ